MRSHGWQGLGLHSGAVSSWERVLKYFLTTVDTDTQSNHVLVAELADMLSETL